MTIAERKAQYENQFNEMAEKIKSMEANLKQAYTVLEQIRGAFMAFDAMEKEDVKLQAE